MSLQLILLSWNLISRSVRLKLLSLVAGLLAGVSSPSSMAVAETPPLRVISHNVWYGFTLEPQRKVDWLKWMAEQQPDVVSLQELNRYTPAQLKADASAWGHEHTVLLKEGGFPTGFTSRTPITETKRMLEGFHHGLLRCQTQGIYFYVIHLHPSNWEFRHREVELLLADLAGLPPNASVMLIGDFNTFSPADRDVYAASPDMILFFERLDERDRGKNLRAGQLDFTHLERLDEAGLIDLIAARRKEFVGTFPAGQRVGEDVGPSRRLDYIFVTSDLQKRCIAAEIPADARTAQFSDHFPVRADFRGP